jgi:hypothetical protein
MKRNIFTAALESNDKPVGPDAIHTQQDLQPKPGFGEDKSLAIPSDDDVKATKEFGEEHAFGDHDEIDTVAESQEHTLALEHLHAAVARYSRFANALEELAEQVEGRLEEGNPLEASETAMLTTAVDAAGIGAPLSESVALESFEFSAQVATEGFVETLKERSSKVFEALKKFGNRINEEMKVRYSTLGAALKKYPDARIKPLKKNITAVEGFAGRNFEDSKREKAIQGKIFAPSSVKNPLAALKESLAAYDAAATVMDSRLATAQAQAIRAYSTESADKVVPALNKLLTVLGELSTKHSVNSNFTAINVSVDVKTITSENATKLSVAGFKRTAAKGGFDNSLKIASAADLSELESLVAKASRIFDVKVKEVTSVLMTMVDAKMNNRSTTIAAGNKMGGGIGSRRVSPTDNNGWSDLKMMAAYRYTMYATAYTASSVELGLAEGVFRNAIAAADWVAASIAEAKAMSKAA